GSQEGGEEVDPQGRQEGDQASCQEGREEGDQEGSQEGRQEVAGQEDRQEGGSEEDHQEGSGQEEPAQGSQEADRQEERGRDHAADADALELIPRAAGTEAPSPRAQAEREFFFLVSCVRVGPVGQSPDGAWPSMACEGRPRQRSAAPCSRASPDQPQPWRPSSS